MGLLDKLLTGGGAVLIGAAARRIYRDAQETRRRKNSPLCFDEVLTQSEFIEIARDAAKRTPRVEDIVTTGMTVNLYVRSNSGLSTWKAEIDFNDYGHLTGKYWLDIENSDSLIPKHFADAVQAQIGRAIATERPRPRAYAGALGPAIDAIMPKDPTRPPAGWYPDPEGSGQRWWDGVMWGAPTLPSPTDISNLTFTMTQFRRGYDQQDVDEYLDLIAANLAFPLAQRTLRPEEVRAVKFSATQFRTGYDEAEVDRVLDQLAVDLGLP